jgi:P22 coat protein - gene protein 5
MANILTDLEPVIYVSLDTVASEQKGFIPSVTLDAAASQAAVGQIVRSPYTIEQTEQDITPGVTPPNTGTQTIAFKDSAISKSKSVAAQWTGEEIISLAPGQYPRLQMNQFQQAFRRLGNLVDTDLAVCAYQNSSRASGTAGTTPFATKEDFSDFAAMNRILDDNGCPVDGDRALVLSSSAMQNLRGKQSSLFKANEAASVDLLRRNIIGQVENFNIQQSRFVQLPAVGAGNTATVTANVVGDTALLCSGNAASILAGDVITIAGDTANQYVVANVVGQVVNINAPGLQKAATSELVTVVGASTRNIALHKSAIILLARQPQMPPGGDSAVETIAVTDPKSGMTYQVSLYREYHQIHFEVGLAWGVSAVKNEFIATLLG